MRIPTRTGAWIIEALGASPVAMPVPELPQALQKGVVDGAFIPWEIIPPLKIQDQTAYQVEGVDDEARFGTTTFQVSMNQGRWDSLPDDVKQAFKDASGRTGGPRSARSGARPTTSASISRSRPATPTSR